MLSLSSSTMFHMYASSSVPSSFFLFFWLIGSFSDTAYKEGTADRE